MKRTAMTKALSFVLTLIMVFVSYVAMPVKALAEDAEEAPQSEAIEANTDQTEFSRNPQLGYSPLISEIESNRSESEKRFLRADGAVESVLYPYPVHIKENGKWKDIDNTLIPLIDELGQKIGYRTTFGVDIQFGESLASSELVQYMIDDESVSWRFLQLDSNEAEILSQSNEPFAGLSKDKQHDMELRFPKTLSSEILYENPETGVSVRYVLTSYTLSEFITISEKPVEKVVFQLELKCDGLTPLEQKDGSVLFKNDQGEIVFSMSAPIMEDANSEQSDRFKVSLMSAEEFVEWMKEEKAARAERIQSGNQVEQEMQQVTVTPEVTASVCRSSFIRDISDEEDDEQAESTDAAEYAMKLKMFSAIRLNLDPESEENDLDLIPEYYDAEDIDENLSASLFSFADKETIKHYRIYGSYKDKDGFYACDENGEAIEFDAPVSEEADRMLFEGNSELIELSEASENDTDPEEMAEEDLLEGLQETKENEISAEAIESEPNDVMANEDLMEDDEESSEENELAEADDPVISEEELIEADRILHIMEDIPLPEYSTENIDSETYIYMLEPDMDWLLDENRAYPVVVDPDIRPPFSGTVDDTYISYQSQNSNYNTRDRLKIGGTPHYRSLIKINGLPDLETGDVIVEATLNLSRYNTSSAYGKEIDLYKVLKAWDFSTVTWSNFQPDSTTSVERGHISAVAATAEQNKFNQFDITDLVKFWYLNPSQNFGVILESWKESSNWYTEYRSSDYNSTYSGHPYFSIIYVNSTGLEDRFTYHSQNAGRAGTGSVNDFSGNLTWAHADASISNGVLPILLSHVYNTNDRLTDIGYGYGWRLNYSQSLKKVELTNRTETTTYYQLTDGDGTRHYYKYSSTNTYVNELDKNSTLTISGTTATVSDKGGNKLIFSCDANVNNGRLTTVEDANGNQTIITYLSTTITDLRISAVQEQLSGQSVGQSLTLSYSGDLLSAVTSPDGLNVSYSYSSGDLTGITYADNQSCAYTYENHCITKATNIDGYNLNYDYNSVAPYHVTRVEEKAGTTAGQYLTFDYGWNRTTIVDKQERDTTYLFDNNGQAVSVRDNEGNAVYAAYNTDDRTVTQLSALSKTQSTIFNLLKNHGFETTSSSGNPWTRSNTSYVTFSSSYSHTGKYSLKMVSASNRTVYAAQSVTVTGGKTYTFSAYFTGQSGATLQILNGNTVIAQSDAVATSGTVGTDWTRGHVTFTVPSGVSTVTVKIELPSSSVGTLYADSAQLEIGSSPNRYNMIQNGDFSDGMTAWTASSHISSSTDGITTDSTASHPTAFSDSVYHITGTCEYQKYIYQTITVAGKKGDAYSFGAWLRSDSVPLTTQPNGSSTRLYGIKTVSIEFLNGSTTVNSSLVYFNADTDEWQFACGSAVAAGTYTSIRISLNFHYTRNHCYYDGIQLYKEEFSQAYTYDASGNLTGYTSLIGQQNSFTYDSNNNISAVTDPKGNQTTYTYDGNHNCLTQTTQQGVVTTNTYNGKGQVTETTVGNSSTYIRSTASYDAATGLTNSVTDARGNSVAYGYDSTTRQNTTVTDPKNNTSTYTYGNASNMLRLTSLQGAGTGSVSYGYDSYGKLTSITHGSTVYGLTYDIWNRSAQTKVGNTALSTNAYDSYGRLSSVTYANGFTAQYTYDELDRVTEIHLNNTLTYAFIYNAEGNLYEQRNYRTHRATFFDYDHAGRCMASLEKSFTGSGSSISYGSIVSSYKYEYDANNNLTKLSNTTAGQSWNTVYTYDGDNRPLTATFGNGKVMTNTYDAIGRITQRRLGLNSNYDTTLTYKPGADGSQTALLATYQNGGDTPYSYEYDANGNITEITQGNVSVTYSYNAANELIRENNGFTNQTVTYAYDNWGNITQKDVYAYTTAADPGTPTQTIPYAYTNSSWGDQLTSYNNQSILYDATGNPTSYLGQTLTWRGKQLTAVGTTTYEYDENGLRLNKTVNNVSTDYYYNGSVLMSLVTGNDTLLFSYDASGKVVAVNCNGTYYYYLRNGQGDIVKLIDNSGATVVEYSYDTWGKQLSCTGTLASTLGTLNPFRYRGYVYDEETQWYYLRSRYYDPTIGRFISADVLLSTGQGVLGHNAYAYCLNNPVNMADSSGKFPEWTILIIIVVALLASTTGCDNSEEYVEEQRDRDDYFDETYQYLAIIWEGGYKSQGPDDPVVFPTKGVPLPRGIHINYKYVIENSNTSSYIDIYGKRGFTDRLVDYLLEKYYNEGVVKHNWEELSPDFISALYDQVYNDFDSFSTTEHSRNYISYY